MFRFSTGCETLAIADKVVAKYSNIPTLCNFCTCFAVVLERFCSQNPKSQKFKLKQMINHTTIIKMQIIILDLDVFEEPLNHSRLISG